MNTLKQRGAFISYSRKDKEFALALASELRAAGYLIWLDQLDIPTGARWDDEVEKALHDYEIFLIILTPSSVSSENVKDEIGYAIDHGKRIMPVLLEACDVPLRLRRFQYVDFTKLEFSEGIARAKQLLNNLLNEESKPVTTSPEREQPKAPDREVIPAYSLPNTKKPVPGRSVGAGVGIFSLVACLGLLGILILLRRPSFPGIPVTSTSLPDLTVTPKPSLPSGTYIIPVGDSSVTIDGVCNIATEYNDALREIFQDFDQQTGTVYLKHDGEFLYVCMEGAVGTNPDRFVSLEFATNSDPIVSINASPVSGATSASTGITGWSASALTGSKEIAEFRVPIEATYGSPCYKVFRMSVFHFWMSGMCQ